MTRRSFLQRAVGVVALTLAAVYAPSLKAVAVVSRSPIKRSTDYWITLSDPSSAAAIVFKRFATEVLEHPEDHGISGRFVGGSRGLHRAIGNEFSSWHASATPPQGA